jgi:hypothetical protein
VQCVAAPESIKEHHLKLEDAVQTPRRGSHPDSSRSFSTVPVPPGEQPAVFGRNLGEITLLRQRGPVPSK